MKPKINTPAVLLKAAHETEMSREFIILHDCLARIATRARDLQDYVLLSELDTLGLFEYATKPEEEIGERAAAEWRRAYDEEQKNKENRNV
jgi:hypothetical protein